MLLRTVVTILRVLFRTRSELTHENLALRNQLMVLQRHVKRPQLDQTDRLLWILLMRRREDWRPSLVLVKPNIVVDWHWIISSCWARDTCGASSSLTSTTTTSSAHIYRWRGTHPSRGRLSREVAA